MARFILTPFGSGGDVNPHLWLGRLLQARGHEVRIITVPMFREVTERAGLPFTGVGDEAEFYEILNDQRLWKPIVGSKLVLHHALRALPQFFDAISAEIAAGPTVLVSPFHQFAARLAREKFRVPLVTVHLQPTCFFSAWDTPIFFTWMGWVKLVPRWIKQLVLASGNPLNGMLRRGLRKSCETAGVPVPARPIPDWMHSPDANLALFPEWFAAPQPDWPPHTHATGFPQEDLRGQFSLSPEMESFLSRGDKPLLFSAGTGNAQSRDFFVAGLGACEKLGMRALLGTRFPEQLPRPLPSWARTFDYLPFSEILPRVSVLVHHGGIGTMSQAMAAGVPQLVMPMAHDQPDNASRMKRLGSGDYLAPRKFTPDNVARALCRLTADRGTKEACERIARLCRQDRAAETALGVLEAMAHVQR